MREKLAAGRDIAPDRLTAVNLRKRRAAERSLLTFCRTCLANDRFFPGPMYRDQVRRLRKIERAILVGDDIAIAAQRGGGKTSEARAATLWCLLGAKIDPMHAVLIGATTADAANHLEAIKRELQENDALLERWPEVCVLVRSLDNSPRRAPGQTVGGKHTHIRWEQTRIVFPTLPAKLVPWYRGSGAVLQVRSADGALRGLNVMGKRPGFVMLDDIETEESVSSDRQTKKLREKIDQTIGGLAAHTGRLTRLMLCTVQTEDCLAEEFTDPQKRPSWHGIRQQYMITWPADWTENGDRGLWGRYMEIRRDALFGGPDAARQFYREHRNQMDAGAVVAWPAGFNRARHDSAVEKLFAQWADGRENGLRYVALELQNDPTMLRRADDRDVTEAGLCARTNGLDRLRIPAETQALTCFVDVHGVGSHLYYAVAAVGGGFRPVRFIDWGTWPDAKSIGDAYPGVSQEAAIRRALDDFADRLDSMRWTRDDGMDLPLRCGVDSGSGWASTVYEFCRARARGNWVPTKGENPKWKTFGAMGPRDALRGNNWREMPVTSGKYRLRAFLVNVCYWKRFLRDRLLIDRNEPEAATFWGHDPRALLPLARHILAETPALVTEKATGVDFEEWRVKPNWPNHWWDALVGAVVVASLSGVQLSDTAGQATARPAVRQVRRARVVEV